jgi:hypothetical protein
LESIKSDSVQRWRAKLALSGIAVSLDELTQTAGNEKHYLVTGIDTRALSNNSDELEIKIPEFKDVKLGVASSACQDIMLSPLKYKMILDLSSIDYTWVLDNASVATSIDNLSKYTRSLERMYRQALVTTKVVIKHDFSRIRKLFEEIISNIENDILLYNAWYIYYTIELLASLYTLETYRQFYKWINKATVIHPDLYTYKYRASLLDFAIDGDKMLDLVYKEYMHSRTEWLSRYKRATYNRIYEQTPVMPKQDILKIKELLTQLIDSTFENRVICDMNKGIITILDDKLREHKRLIGKLVLCFKSIKLETV